MPDETPENQRSQLKWPKFAVAGVLLAMVLAAVWITAEARRIRNARSFNSGSAGAGPLNATPDRAAASSSGTNDLLFGGDAERGRKIFFEKPEANCAKCHRVADAGGDQGPPLDGVGARESRQSLLDSMIRPNAKVTEGYDSVVLLLTNQTGLAGILKQETGTQLSVLTPEDGLVLVEKSSIQIRQRGLSPMPEHLEQMLSAQDLRDLVEYLATLR